MRGLYYNESDECSDIRNIMNVKVCCAATTKWFSTIDEVSLDARQVELSFSYRRIQLPR